MGRDIHHRSNLHSSSMHATRRHLLPNRTDTGFRPRPSSTTTATGPDTGFNSAGSEESMGTRRVRISGAGCRGTASTTRYRAGLPPVRARRPLSHFDQLPPARLPDIGEQAHLHAGLTRKVVQGKGYILDYTLGMVVFHQGLNNRKGTLPHSQRLP